MIILQYPSSTPQIQAWAERLDNLIVGYRAEEDPQLNEPLIEENGELFAGAEAVEKFIVELEKEVGDWRTPRCGV